LDSGAVGLGRGGAFVARGDDPTTIRYNPAGLVKLRNHHLTAAGQVSYVNSLFSRSANGGTLTHAPVGNTQPLRALPSQLMFTTDLALFERLTLAVGFHVPPAVMLTFPEEVKTDDGAVAAPQRYQAISGKDSSVLVYPSFAAAFRVMEWLDVGASFELMVLDASSGAVTTAGSACQEPEDPACDITMHFRASDPFTFTGSAGILIRPLPGLEFGVAARLPTTCNAKGKAEISLGPGVARLNDALTIPVVSPLDPTVTLKRSTPWMVRGGVRYGFALGSSTRGDVEVDVVWENWSAAAKNIFHVHAESMGEPMEPQTLDWRFKDTLSARLGGELVFELSSDTHLTARAGFFYETATNEVSHTNLAAISPPRMAPTVGVGLQWGSLALNLAYSHVFFPKRIVRGSAVVSRDMGGGDGSPVGNGTYTTTADLFALQLTVRFGESAPAGKRRGRPKRHSAGGPPAGSRVVPTMERATIVPQPAPATSPARESALGDSEDSSEVSANEESKPATQLRKGKKRTRRRGKAGARRRAKRNRRGPRF
jgi:long-subunit fatty acid transport protein